MIEPLLSDQHEPVDVEVRVVPLWVHQPPQIVDQTAIYRLRDQFLKVVEEAHPLKILHQLSRPGSALRKET